jgi:hypothetical protein
MKNFITKARLGLVFFLLIINIVSAQVYFRLNQLGYLPNDIKTAIILSDNELQGREFVVKNQNGKISDRGIIKQSIGEYGNFRYIYEIDFTLLSSIGKYYIQIADFRSPKFSIDHRLYNSITDAVLSFYKVQRCGYTSPVGHEICHIADATSLIENGVNKKTSIDVTGGWHDAGDYTKFLNTTAFTTYMLLFAYDFDPVKFGFDNNRNNIPDILEEAKIGLDWLIRASYNSKFITQVQDEDDQTVGWRMPEDDPLQFDRPAFVGIGKNLIGIYVATLSLASRIWQETLRYNSFAEKCLTLAENYYSLRNNVPNISGAGTGVYIDKSFEGKMALGAVELYFSTNRQQLLDEARTYADLAKSDYWWSWGDINALAHYRLSSFDKTHVEFLKNNLEHFHEFSKENVFERGVDVSWGTNHAILGVVLQNILYEKLTGDKSYSIMASKQRDYILGRNPWGVSFVSDFGEIHTKYFHHQVAHFNGGKIPGAVAAGPIPKSILEERKIEFERPDRFVKFQTEDMVYFDDRMDYISNEPTISSNATALFVFGFFSSR